ncbi:MAG: capsular polysaccharide biosynthesis protein [Sulfitobacter sp.]
MALGPEIYDDPAAGPEKARRLFVYNGGFLTQRRLRRILQLSGYAIHLGRPDPARGDAIGIWGNSPTAHRGRAMATRSGAPLICIEDAWLRSLFPGRKGEPPLGLLIDTRGAHFDPAQPSDLEMILAHDPLDDTALLNRARGAIARLRGEHLTKYAGVDPAAPLPAPGYVLVIDQIRGDASVTASGADRARFLEMLVFAQEEHPGARILIKTHPETAQGLRPGYFTDADCNARISMICDPVSPWALLEGAIGVYTVSSGLGFEAIFAGHKPRVFGQPFYAGWGLTEDAFEVQRRQRILTRPQLFAGAMMRYPKWYDPYRDQLCNIETAIDTLAAQARSWREDRAGWTASGMRLWKRAPLRRFFGAHGALRFTDTPAPPRPHMLWASKPGPCPPGAFRCEDGFLRSRGLGAALTPPLSLVLDDLGIYYDPAQPSRLERHITARADLRPDQSARARALITALNAHGLSKYNIGAAPSLPDMALDTPRILVPGQVEDDASIRTGAGQINTNAGLLAATRAANPDALILYKPHPDVEAGLRSGACDAAKWADHVIQNADPAALLDTVDQVWTMTSLLGFEALLRGVPVTTFGAPFYAGWGLTTDLGDVPPRRRARPALEGLVHAALIDYPRYFDPVTNLPCPPEVVIDRLASGTAPRGGPLNRGLSKLQGLMASQSWLWRGR